MNPLVTGWFDTLLILISAVTAFGWIMGSLARGGHKLIPVIRLLNRNEPLSHQAVRRDYESVGRYDRRKRVSGSILSP